MRGHPEISTHPERDGYRERRRKQSVPWSQGKWRPKVTCEECRSVTCSTASSYSCRTSKKGRKEEPMQQTISHNTRNARRNQPVDPLKKGFGIPCQAEEVMWASVRAWSDSWWNIICHSWGGEEPMKGIHTTGAHRRPTKLVENTWRISFPGPKRHFVPLVIALQQKEPSRRLETWPPHKGALAACWLAVLISQSVAQY
jgi:hypothetical protein